MASSSPAPNPSSTPSAPSTTTSSTLPPLTPHEFNEFNRLAAMMDLYHNHFRSKWETLHSAAKAGSRPPHLSLKAFIDEGLLFVRMLTAHHGIEETYLYPQLEGRMPEFRVHAHAYDHSHGAKGCDAEVKGSDGEGKTDEKEAKEEVEVKEPEEGKDEAKSSEPEYPPDLIGQHRAIHKGMDEFEDYLRACRRGEKELSLATLKTQMDSWGGVLWRHLDEEVVALGAENMRKYWTIAEMRSFGM